MKACTVSARCGSMWVVRYYPINVSIAVWMSMTAIQTAKIASMTTAIITSLTSLKYYHYRAHFTSSISQCIHALLTPWGNYIMQPYFLSISECGNLALKIGVLSILGKVGCHASVS